MTYKARVKSAELQILGSLNNRMKLHSKDKQYYLNLKRGFEGELLFDSMTNKLECDCLILNDLLLKSNNTTFQIDSLIITAKTIYLYEVKNYKGDYCYEKEKFFKIPQYEIINPLHQIGRSESLLRQLLLMHKINLPIEASIVFINPEFTLYQAPFDKRFVFPTQIKRYLQQLNSLDSTLNESHRLLADKLNSLHLSRTPFNQLPSYNYDLLRKGINCFTCHSFSLQVEGRKLVCKKCGYVEIVALAVMRTIKEFKLLFPKITITTKVIHEWCQVIESRKVIRNVLNQNFTMIGNSRATYYK